MNALDKVISDLNKKYKTELVQKGTALVYSEKIPFTSPRANFVTYGGVPIGKSTEFLGPENGGKTTSALDIVGNAQKLALKTFKDRVDSLQAELNNLLEKDSKQAQKDASKVKAELDELKELGPKKVVYVDAENTLDEAWARKLGVDTDELYLIRPQDHTAEQVLQMIIDICNSGQVICLVLDSIPSLVSQKLYDKTMEDKSYAGISDAAAEFSRKISSVISKHHTALIMINQIRDNMQNPFDRFHTPGGRALKHLHALRLFFAKGSFFDEDNKELPKKAETPCGNLVDMTIVKTKVCKPDRRIGFYTLNYSTGIDVLNDTVDLAIKFDFIVQSGSWFSFINPETGEVMQDNSGDDLKFQGKASLLDFLRDDEDMFEELYEAITDKLKAS